MSEEEYRGRQNGSVVFGVSAPEGRAWNEAMCYALQYAVDGPVEIQQKINKRWKAVTTITSRRPASIDSAIEAVADAWASMDGHKEAFRACKTDPVRERSEGRYMGYMADAESLMGRVLDRGFKLVSAED